MERLVGFVRSHVNLHPDFLRYNRYLRQNVMNEFSCCNIISNLNFISHKVDENLCVGSVHINELIGAKLEKTGYWDEGYEVTEKIILTEDEIADIEFDMIETQDSIDHFESKISKIPNISDIKILANFFTEHPGEVIHYINIGKAKQRVAQGMSRTEASIHSYLEDDDKNTCLPTAIKMNKEVEDYISWSSQLYDYNQDMLRFRKQLEGGEEKKTFVKTGKTIRLDTTPVVKIVETRHHLTGLMNQIKTCNMFSHLIDETTTYEIEETADVVKIRSMANAACSKNKYKKSIVKKVSEGLNFKIYDETELIKICDDRMQNSVHRIVKIKGDRRHYHKSLREDEITQAISLLTNCSVNSKMTLDDRVCISKKAINCKARGRKLYSLLLR